MPFYQYKCPACKSSYVYEAPIASGPPSTPPECSICEIRTLRNYQFFVKNSFREHYNAATGTYVNNRTQLLDDLKKASDDASEYTGMTHNFQPREWGDLKPDNYDEFLDAKASGEL